MTDSSKVELPESYYLTILEINGIPVEKLPRPLTGTDEDSLRVRIEDIHIDAAALAKEKYLYVKLAELREMQHPVQGNQLVVINELSGEPGVSAGEVKIARRLIEKIRRKQPERRGEKPNTHK
jgi:hypothetical protein